MKYLMDRERALLELMEATQRETPSKHIAAVLRRYEACEFHEELIAKAKTLLALLEARI